MFKAPQVGIADHESEAGIDDAHRSKLPRAYETHTLEMVGVVLTAVRNAQQALRRLARIDHPLALFYRHFHRLFAEHMLSCFGGEDGLLAVQGVGSHDIDNVDVVVVGHLPHGLVGIDAVIGNCVAGFPFADFFRRPGDDAGEAAVLGLLQGRRNLVLAEPAQSAQGKADFLARLLRLRTGDGSADERRSRDRGRLQHESST